MLTGIDLSPSLIGRLAGEYPNVIGLKDTVTEYFHTVAVLREIKPIRPDFAVLSGWEDLILPSLLAGADGSICAFANVAPELFVSLVEAAKSGDLTKAAELHRRVLTLVTLGAYSDPPIGAIKVAMSKLGVPISPTVRGPALPATDEEAIEAVLRDVGLLDTSKMV
jgi:4-hydroxy-tetrahydrodipicolinate synthase